MLRLLVAVGSLSLVGVLHLAFECLHDLRSVGEVDLWQRDGDAHPPSQTNQMYICFTTMSLGMAEFDWSGWIPVIHSPDKQLEISSTQASS